MFILPFSIISGVENTIIETLPFCKIYSLKGSKSAPQLHKETQLKIGCVHTRRSTAWIKCSRCAFLMLLYFLLEWHKWRLICIIGRSMAWLRQIQCTKHVARILLKFVPQIRMLSILAIVKTNYNEYGFPFFPWPSNYRDFFMQRQKKKWFVLTVVTLMPILVFSSNIHVGLICLSL